MDEMSIKTGFMRGIISKIVTKFVTKKTGYDIKIEVDELDVKNFADKAVVRIALQGDINREDLKKILAELGL
jgi:hypothetical protein